MTSNERKFRRAVNKAGLVDFPNVSKVIIERTDGTNYVIDDPKILNTNDSYAIFGETKLQHKKLISVSYMNCRIKAKIYESDTMQNILGRLRSILPTVEESKMIGLYHFDLPQKVLTYSTYDS